MLAKAVLTLKPLKARLKKTIVDVAIGCLGMDGVEKNGKGGGEQTHNIFD